MRHGSEASTRRSLVAWSRFGGELRMSATAEFVGYDRSSTPADYAGHHRRRQSVVPRRHRLGHRAIPHRTSPDDARRPADDRPWPPRQPVLQHRTWPRRMDHGVRLGSNARRHDRRTASRHRPDALLPNNSQSASLTVSPRPCRCRRGRPHRGAPPSSHALHARDRRDVDDVAAHLPRFPDGQSRRPSHGGLTRDFAKRTLRYSWASLTDGPG